MASTGKKRSLMSRVLDMIGLVENEQEEDMETPERGRSVARTRARRETNDEFGEFEDDGRRHMPHTTPRPAARAASPRPVRPARPARSRAVEDPAFEDEFNDVEARRTRGTARTGTSQGYAAWSSLNPSSRTPPENARRSERAPERPAYERPPLYERYDDTEEPAGEEEPPKRARYSRESAPPARHQTVIFTLKMVDDCKDVIVALVDKKSVLLNLEKLDAVSAQRVVDMMAGATFAIDASMSSAGNRTWLITPSTVDVERSASESARY